MMNAPMHSHTGGGGSAKPFRVAALVLIALPLLVLLLGLLPGSRDVDLAVPPAVLAFCGAMLMLAIVLMVLADRAAGGFAGASVVPPLLGGGCLLVLAILLGFFFGGGGGFVLSSLTFLVGFIILAAALMGADLTQFDGGGGYSHSGGGGSGSLRARAQQLEEHVGAIEAQLGQSKTHAQELERRMSAVNAQLTETTQDLEREKGEVRRLQGEVDELRPRSSRLGELEAWMWPASGSAGSTSSLWKAIEEGCKNQGVRSIGQSLFGRLHLIMASEESEPDRFADLLDRAGRDFYKWLDASDNASGDAPTLENEFIAVTKEQAARHNLEIRRVRAGDTVNQEIHDPTGAGLQVMKAKSFYIRRTKDQEVLRRARVDV